MANRVVITGLGAITPIGIGKDAYWENLLKGVSGAKRFSFTDRGYPYVDMNQYRSQVAAFVEDFDPYDYVPLNKTTKLDRSNTRKARIQTFATHQSRQSRNSIVSEEA